jgi:hypothetical protein
MFLCFSNQQKAAIENGRVKRRRLIRVTAQAAKCAKDSITYIGSDGETHILQEKKSRHYYIYGPSGIGKTYNMERELEKSGVPYYVISGNISMWAFGVQLACIKVAHPTEKVVIVVDDCDELLKDGKSVNEVKELLAESRFSYNKKPQMHMLTSDAQIQCVEQFMSNDKLGFQVPTENFTFVITSNFQLPYDSTPEEMLRKNGDVITPRIAYMKHLTAIRGRMETKDIDLTMEEKWGNIAEVLMNDGGCHFLNEQQRIYLLQWMWNNWDNMTETSIRTAEKMARIMIEEGEDGVQDAWEIDFLK